MKEPLRSPEDRNLLGAPATGFIPLPVKDMQLVRGAVSGALSPSSGMDETSPGADFTALQTLFSEHGGRDEVALSRVCNALAGHLVEDLENVNLWQQALDRAARFDGTSALDDRPELSADAIVSDILQGGRPNLEVWIRSCADYLRESLENGSLRNASISEVYRAFREAQSDRTESLFELARGLRHAIAAQMIVRDASQILAERERRVRQQLDMGEHDPLEVKPRQLFPHYLCVTLGQMIAYRNGDRSDAVFGIGEQVPDPFIG